MLIWLMTVFRTKSILLFEVVLLGATIWADTRDAVSSERYSADNRRERVAACILKLEMVDEGG